MCSGEIKNKQEEDEFFAKMDMYHHMAYYVAKKLHLSPYDILNKWSVPQLIVAYGHYQNIDSYQNYLNWEKQSIKTRGKCPKKIAVPFERP